MFLTNYRYLNVNYYLKSKPSICTCLSLLLIIGNKTVQAQSITIDGSTDTNIDQDINQYNISGGASSENNIFHSFEEFGLNQGEIANFLVELETRNIFSRITEGNASVIDGLLKVTGGSPNLFFVNPSGIIFGENSNINVPASFTATTANGIQIGEFWYDALGENNYENLGGQPSSFAFLGTDLGNIINLGNINVGVAEDLSLNNDGLLIDAEGNLIIDSPLQNQGETIHLVGGSVINTGSLKTPGGTINIMAVPGQQLVRITPEGSLLSLVLPTEAATILQPGIDATENTPPTLPELLTGGGITEATAIEIVDGVIRLTGSDTEIPSSIGTTIASGNLDASNNTSDGGNVNINGEKIGIIQSNIDTSGDRGGSISLSSEGEGIELFSDSSRILLDSNSTITAVGTGDPETGTGTGGTLTINSNGAIAFDLSSADSATSFSTIDVSGISNNGTVEIKAENNIVAINIDNILDYYLDGLPSYLNFNSVDNITLKSKDIKLVGANSILGENANINEDININNFFNADTIPSETTVIPVDNLVQVENVIIEASSQLVFDRDTLVELGTISDAEEVNNSPQFISALIEPENIDSEPRIPLEDIPVFQNLTLKVEPPAAEIGLLNIQGSFAVTNELVVENSRGDIIIEPQLPELINFTSDSVTTDVSTDPLVTTGGSEDIQYLGSNGSLFIGLDNILFGVEPDGVIRNGLGSATIKASQGSVELLRGMTLNADTNLDITAQRFIGSGTTTLLGNGPNGEPGRSDSEFSQTYTIGVLSSGGVSLDLEGQPVFDAIGEVQLTEEGSSDPEPNLQLVVAFNPDNPILTQPEAILLAGDEDADATSDIEITLLSDPSFIIGEFDPDDESGIVSIARITRISTNGSLVGNTSPLEEIALAPEIVTDLEPEIIIESEPEIVSEPDLEPEIITESEPEIVLGPDLEPEIITESEPEIVFEPDLEPEIITEMETEADSELPDLGLGNISNLITTESESGTSAKKSELTIRSDATAPELNIVDDSVTKPNTSSSDSEAKHSTSTTESTSNQLVTADSSPDITSSSSSPSSAVESSSDAVNQANSNAADQANSNTTDQANSNAADRANSNAADQANSNAADQANSNAADQANSNAADQANSNAADLPASKTAPLPENNLGPLSQRLDNNTVALIPEESATNFGVKPIKHWAIPIAGGLLLIGGATTLLTNTLVTSTLSTWLGNILSLLGSNFLVKPEPNSNNKSDQENPQKDPEIKMESTMEPGLIQLSEFPILDFEISLELEPDPGVQTIHIQGNLVDHDRVEIKVE